MFYPLAPKLVSALYCLCEEPTLLERIFRNSVANEHLYEIELCISGQWTKVAVDSYFPHKPLEGPLFVGGWFCEIWMQVIEKALSKVVGSYSNLRKLETEDILYMLTGSPVEIYILASLQISQDTTVMWDNLRKSRNINELVVFSNDYQDNLPYANESMADFKDTSFSYALLEMEEINTNRYFKIRDPLDIHDQNLMLAGQQGFRSFIKKRASQKRNSEGGDTFSVSLRDIYRKFDKIFVVKPSDWEELRLPGQFITFNDSDHKERAFVISRHAYIVETEHQQTVTVYIHQDSFAHEFVRDFRAPLTVGIVIYRKTDTSETTLYKYIDMQRGHRVGRDITLDEGLYTFVVVTPTPRLQQNPEHKDLTASILNSAGNFSLKMIDCILELFRRLDINLQDHLETEELRVLFEALGITLTKDLFDNNLLPKYNTNNRFQKLGLKRFLYDVYLEIGEESFRKFLFQLGYNDSLFCMNSRSFIISLHSYSIFIDLDRIN